MNGPGWEGVWRKEGGGGGRGKEAWEERKAEKEDREERPEGRKEGSRERQEGDSRAREKK